LRTNVPFFPEPVSRKCYARSLQEEITLLFAQGVVFPLTEVLLMGDPFFTPRPLEEIEADIRAVEEEILAMLKEMTE